MRRRNRNETEERVHVREWWREEAGSDALMSLKAKLKLWIARAREASDDG